MHRERNAADGKLSIEIDSACPRFGLFRGFATFFFFFRFEFKIEMIRQRKFFEFVKNRCARLSRVVVVDTFKRILNEEFLYCIIPDVKKKGKWIHFGKISER